MKALVYRGKRDVRREKGWTKVILHPAGARKSTRTRQAREGARTPKREFAHAE